MPGVFIYIYDLTTGQLTNTHVPGMNPDWSPLGDKIAYMSAGDIYYMDYPFVQEPSTLGKMKAMYK
jgi:Tol biopolymer transport system component